MFHRKEKKFEKLRQAIAADDPALADIGYFSGDKCFEASKLAIEGNAQKVFSALAKGKHRGYYTSFAFGQQFTESKQRARQLLDIIGARQKDPLAFWTIMHEASAGAERNQVSLPEKDFLTRSAPSDFIRQQLVRNPELFKTCLFDIGLHDGEKLKFILTLVPEGGNVRNTLSDALIKTAASGDVEKSALLLEHGANPEYAGGIALHRALENGHDKVAAIIRAAAKKSATPQTATAVAPDAAALVEKETLQNGGTLTTVFNFRTRQQHNALQLPDGTKLMTTVNFKDIDKTVIAAAEEKYAAEKAAREQRPVNGNIAAKDLVKRLKGTGLS